MTALPFVDGWEGGEKKGAGGLFDLAAVEMWDDASLCAGTAAAGGSGAKRISPILFMLFCRGVMSTSQLISNSSEPERKDGEKHANHVRRWSKAMKKQKGMMR